MISNRSLNYLLSRIYKYQSTEMHSWLFHQCLLPWIKHSFELWHTKLVWNVSNFDARHWSQLFFLIRVVFFSQFAPLISSEVLHWILKLIDVNSKLRLCRRRFFIYFATKSVELISKSPKSDNSHWHIMEATQWLAEIGVWPNCVAILRNAFCTTSMQD